MTQKQQTLLEKEFKVNEHFAITRGDYENMPCPMLAWTWSDERMKELAANISTELSQYRYASVDKEGLKEEMDDAFWKEMEDCAVRMGMEYYEDFDDDYRAELEYDWMNLK